MVLSVQSDTQIRLLKKKEQRPDPFSIIIGDSQGIKESVRLALKVAQTGDTTVLVEGETGTGKELIARIIHDYGARAGEPYVCLNCGAISKDLVESELFGYEKGTFTGGLQEGKKGKFELANGGTILLDEISELIPAAQVKLLRILEERTFYPVGGTEAKKVDVRVIALTNKNLAVEIKKGAFREDLYYRLNVVRIPLPALRDRREDIIPIASYYMNKFNQKFGKSFKGISKDATTMLMDHPWPGNVRELRNVIERIVAIENDRTIKPSHLAFIDFSRHPSTVVPHTNTRQIEYSKPKETSVKETPGIEIPVTGISLDELNKKLIMNALHIAGGNRARAAKLLGISRATAIYRIQKYNLENKSA